VHAITIDSPAPSTTVTVGPMSTPMVIKATIPAGYFVRDESAKLSYGDKEITSQVAVQDSDFPAGSGHYKFFLYVGTGTHTGCTVTVAAFESANPAVSITKSHADVTVVKQ